MDYMERYDDIRANPSLLLPEAKTVISLALNYYPKVLQPADAPQFSYYAYGEDYHDVARRRMKPLADFICKEYGGECRLCVDTAPLRERYWAQQAGIGFLGRNNQLILPGKGSYFFLCELLTTASIAPDTPCLLRCGNCHRCVDACPVGALPPDYGCLDARRCISCQTIESRLPLPPGIARKLDRRMYGCDACQQACPHNAHPIPTAIEEFAPSEEFLAISDESMTRLSIDDFRRLFRHSAVKRAKYEGLMRNFAALQNKITGKGTPAPSPATNKHQ